jgi:hypothetical protein
MTKIYSLVFDYQIAKMQASGRHWADEAYKNKDYIFAYSAASIATFLDKNPHLLYTVYTDDPDLLAQKIDAYAVSTNNLNIIDHTTKIQEWTQHSYCFWPLIQVAEMHYCGDEDALKLDNDLTCRGNIDMMLRGMESGVTWAWKHERLCSKGRDYWGESYAARKGLGTDDFHIYNTGVLGVPRTQHIGARKIVEYCEKLIAVDISPVHRFPDKPGVVAKVYNTSDQVAVNYFFHQEKLQVMPGYHFFDHWCYEKTKERVLVEAAYLLKKR